MWWQSRHPIARHQLYQAPAHRLGWPSKNCSPACGWVPASRVGWSPSDQCHCAASSCDEVPDHRLGWQTTHCHPEQKFQTSACVQGGLAAPSSLSRPGTPGGSRPGTPGGAATPVTLFNANYVPQVGHSLAACREAVAFADLQDVGDLHSCHGMHRSRHTCLAATNWQSRQWRPGSRARGAPADVAPSPLSPTWPLQRACL